MQREASPAKLSKLGFAQNTHMCVSLKKTPRPNGGVCKTKTSFALLNSQVALANGYDKKNSRTRVHMLFALAKARIALGHKI